MAIWVGLDISKDTIDVGYFKNKIAHHFKIENNSVGFKKLMKWIPAESKVLMEATGVYYLKCSTTLIKNNILFL
jgi:transposase